MSFFGRAIAARLANLWRDSDMAKKHSHTPPGGPPVPDADAEVEAPAPTWTPHPVTESEPAPPPAAEPTPEPAATPPMPSGPPPETAAGASHRGGGVSSDTGVQAPGPWQNPGRVYPVSPPPAQWPGL